MLRVKLLRLGAEEHVVLLTMHHIASDGWSMGRADQRSSGVVSRHIAKVLSHHCRSCRFSIGDFAVWQRGWLQGEELERQLGYWREQLGGELPVLELPTDHARPAVPSYRGAHLRVPFVTGSECGVEGVEPA